MLNQFMDDVVSKGAGAVLPHLLADEWLTPIAAAARQYLITVMENAAEGAPQDPFEDDGSNMMLSAAMEAVQAEKGYPAEFSVHEIPEEELHEYLTCYALWAVMVYLGRHGELPVEEPTLETLFDREKILVVERTTPGLSAALHHFASSETFGEA